MLFFFGELDPLYTRSQGQCSTQKSSIPIGAKVEITMSQGWNRRKKLFSICPKLRIIAEFYGLVLAPRLKETIPLNLGSQFATLQANVPAFISKLGPNNTSSKLASSFFSPVLLVKSALGTIDRGSLYKAISLWFHFGLTWYEVCKSSSTDAQYVSLPKYFSHPRLVIYSFFQPRP